MGLLFTSVSDFTTWLAVHREIAYGVLFLGSYFETFIFTCFFVPGQLFFLAGSILAGEGTLSIASVALLSYAGAILGDSSSYFIGRLMQPSVDGAEHRFLPPALYAKVQGIFERYGPKAVFFARFLGPLSWVAPFLAGSVGMRYRTFLLYNVPAVVLAVGKYLVLGYLFGSEYELVLWLFERYFILFLAFLIAAAVVYTGIKNRTRGVLS